MLSDLCGIAVESVYEDEIPGVIDHFKVNLLGGRWVQCGCDRYVNMCECGYVNMCGFMESASRFASPLFLNTVQGT
jgi:hypothetical protein